MTLELVAELRSSTPLLTFTPFEETPCPGRNLVPVLMMSYTLKNMRVTADWKLRWVFLMTISGRSIDVKPTLYMQKYQSFGSKDICFKAT